jgi:hypothetical protein
MQRHVALRQHGQMEMREDKDIFFPKLQKKNW